MNSTHTFAVDIIIRRNKADKEKALLYARITVDGEAKEISLKESITVSEWDSKSETVVGKSIRAKSINNMIVETRWGIKEKYRMMKADQMDITAESLKQFYLGQATPDKGKKLFELLDYFIKIFETKLKKGGFKNYKTTAAYIKALSNEQFKGKTVCLKQVDMQFATDLEFFIRNQPLKDYDPCLGNGVAKHIQRFKRMMNWAARICCLYSWAFLSSSLLDNTVCFLPFKLPTLRRVIQSFKVFRLRPCFLQAPQIEIDPDRICSIISSISSLLRRFHGTLLRGLGRLFCFFFSVILNWIAVKLF